MLLLFDRTAWVLNGRASRRCSHSFFVESAVIVLQQYLPHVVEVEVIQSLKVALCKLIGAIAAVRLRPFVPSEWETATEVTRYLDRVPFRVGI